MPIIKQEEWENNPLGQAAWLHMVLMISDVYSANNFSTEEVPGQRQHVTTKYVKLLSYN